MIMSCFLFITLFLSSGTQLEQNGNFVQAGQAYFEDGDIAGEARILCLFLEEALYAGAATHAYDLILQLRHIPIESSLYDFWYARLSWTCGLSEFACTSLDSIRGTRWLESRSRGLAAQFRGDADTAVDQFILSMEHAATNRQRYYSALDLSFALLQTGRFEEAEDIAVSLAGSFPGERLPLIALALSFHEQNRFGEAMSVLQSLYQNDQSTSTAKYFAAALLEDFE